MTYQDKINETSEEIMGLIKATTQRLGLNNITQRTASDILILVHALHAVADHYLDEISDGQFKCKP